MTSKPAPITDSPLFWVLLFGSVGLVMLTAIEPKYVKRQERIQRMQQSRERARPATAEIAEGDQNADQATPTWQPTKRAGLRPLMLFIAGALVVAMMVMHVRRQSAIAQYQHIRATDEEGKSS